MKVHSQRTIFKKLQNQLIIVSSLRFESFEGNKNEKETSNFNLNKETLYTRQHSTENMLRFNYLKKQEIIFYLESDKLKT